MVRRVPPHKRPKPGEPGSEATALLDLIEEIGPQHELADAIEEAYQERHRGFPEEPRGRTKRRHSTRTS